jgi:hypothetical protein
MQTYIQAFALFFAIVFSAGPFVFSAVEDRDRFDRDETAQGALSRTKKALLGAPTLQASSPVCTGCAMNGAIDVVPGHTSLLLITYQWNLSGSGLCTGAYPNCTPTHCDLNAQVTITNNSSSYVYRITRPGSPGYSALNPGKSFNFTFEESMQCGSSTGFTVTTQATGAQVGTITFSCSACPDGGGGGD